MWTSARCFGGHYCGGPSSTIDHIDPTVLDGDDDPTNWTAACHACNNSKNTLSLILFLGYKQARDAYEPWRQLRSYNHRANVARAQRAA